MYSFSWPCGPPAAGPPSKDCLIKPNSYDYETQKALIEKMPVLKPALGESGENGVMYYLVDASATFFKMMEPVETITF